ncbi:PREDICTED: kelch-like protein 31 [Priapulus caudatus]|uniref:Kelch-like protein 31 n=1 Tax=Priapulus caudatus TaxID=37621 RepID=A0ABM1EYK1_PRICU|nr:PREDICTED: kelch-like protein 31 [Priapulus caudatus]
MNNSGPFPFEYTPSGQNIKIRKEQVVFNQHGVAILVSPAVNQSLDAASEMARSRVERLTSPSDDDRLRHYAVQGLYLRSLYKQRRLTDIAVHVGAQTFHAHKIVLTCRSQHFANMFRRKTRRGASAVADVTLEGVAASAVGALLDYFYGGGLTLDCRNYADVRAAAALLGIDEVTSACDAFADALVSTDTALPLFALASAYGLDDVRRRASGIICRSFGDVIDSEAFLNLSADVLYDILVNDDLQIDSELQCFQAVLRWLDYDTEMRMPEAARLMATVRFRDLSTESMFECLDAAPFLLTLPECRELILAANCCVLTRFIVCLVTMISSNEDQMLKDDVSQGRSMNNRTKTFKIRKPGWSRDSEARSVMRTFGGRYPKVWASDGGVGVATLQTNEKRRIAITIVRHVCLVYAVGSPRREMDFYESLRGPRCWETLVESEGCLYIGARIYVFGGTCSLDNRPVQQTECYDTHARTWLANVKDIVEPAVGLKGIVFKMADKHQSLETRQA